MHRAYFGFTSVLLRAYGHYWTLLDITGTAKDPRGYINGVDDLGMQQHCYLYIVCNPSVSYTLSVSRMNW